MRRRFQIGCRSVEGWPIENAVVQVRIIDASYEVVSGSTGPDGTVSFWWDLLITFPCGLGEANILDPAAVYDATQKVVETIHDPEDVQWVTLAPMGPQ